MSDLIVNYGTIVLSCFISIFLIFDFMERIFIRSYRNKLLYICCFLLSGAVFTLSNLFEIPLVNLSISAAITFSVAIWLYNARKGSDILIVCLFFLFLILVEVVSQLAISFLFSRVYSNPPGNLTQDMITFVLYQLVMFFLTRRKKTFQNPVHWFTLLVIPVISLLLIWLIMSTLTPQSGDAHKLYAAFACLLVFAINITVYFLFSRMAALHEQKEQYAVLEQQKQMQYRFYNELEQKYESTRRLAHDMKNHLHALETLYQTEQADASLYSEKLKVKLDQMTEHIASGKMLNILLYSQKEKADREGIRFDITCEDLDLSFISDFDMVTIFGNLLDNAYEACHDSEITSPFIELHLCQINHFIVFHICNSCTTPPRQTGRQFLSQKTGHSGLGLQNAEATIQTYNGTLFTSYENHTFTVQVTIPGRAMALS